MAQQVTAVCGIDCSECQARKATLANDDALRAKTAAEWSRMYGSDIRSTDINCMGCNSAVGPWFSYCAGMCEIRKCGRARKVETCAECADYACERLAGFFKMAPKAQKNLEARRS
jgi:hypothetical protein